MLRSRADALLDHADRWQRQANDLLQAAADIDRHAEDLGIYGPARERAGIDLATERSVLRHAADELLQMAADARRHVDLPGGL